MIDILENINNYIIVTDRYGKIKYCNKKLLYKIDIDKQYIVDENIEKILYIEKHDIKAIIKDIKKEETVNIDLNLYNKLNKVISFNCKVIVDNFEDKESIFIIGEELEKKSYTREDLDNLLDNLPFSIWIKNKNGKYRYLNNTYAKSCGIDKNDIIGKCDSDYWEEEVCKLFDNRDQNVIKSKTPIMYDEIVERNKVKEYFETYKSPIFDNDGELLYTIGCTRNVTIEKRLTEEIANNNNIMQIKDILKNENRNLDTGDVIYKICEEAYKYVESDSLSLLSYNKNSEKLENLIHFGRLINTVDKKLYDLSNSEYQKVLNFEKYDGIKHIDEVNYPSIKEFMKDYNINYLGTYNITFKGELLGILVIKYFDDNKLKINMDDNIRAICSHLGLHIKNTLLSKDVKNELERRIETEKELADFIEISVDLVAKIALNGDILMANSQWEHSFGWNEEELLKINLNEIIDSDVLDLEFNEIMENKRNYNRGITKIKNKYGEYKYLEWNYKVIRDKDYLVITAKDITNQLEEEENKRKLEEAIKLESFKNEFFANISHEFKTPLNIILGAIQLISKNIKNENLSEQAVYTRYIKPIRQNSYRLLRLVNNLIDITRIDTGFYEIQLGNYDIVNIVENITLSVAQYIEDKGVNLIFDTNYEEKIIACDPDKIERIMLNLLSNAIKYTNVNGNIFVYLNVENDKVIISVEDDGIGIEEEKLGSIFVRFKQVDNVLTRKCEGSGIGLSLVKSLVELHGGNINVVSKVNKGTKFTFELPIKVVEDNKDKPLYNSNNNSMQIEKCNIEFSDIYV